MPIYEYECDDCHIRFEKKQRITDEPITVCPECGGETRRLISPVGIIFKGSGFYCTDNRSSGGGGRSDSSNKAVDSTSESKEDKPNEKLEEKTAEKSESKTADGVLAGSSASSS